MWGGIPKPKDYVHIDITFITMLEIVLKQDNFLTILMSIGTHCSLNRGMTAMIPITQHGTINLISRDKIKLLKIMLQHCKNCSNKHIWSSMINHIPLN